MHPDTPEPSRLESSRDLLVRRMAAGERVAGVTMRAGDYCRADAGSVHDRSRTVGGCVFVVTACAHDDYPL